MNIRIEAPSDMDAIHAITVAAFKDLPISRQTEQHIIAALRAADALTVSLVAEDAGQVVGHIAFSPITISDGTPQEVFLCMPFTDAIRQGTVTFHQAFLANG
jgi:putative acetyltransferase